MNVEREFTPITIVLQTEEEASFLMGILGITRVIDVPAFRFYSDLYDILEKNGVTLYENIDGTIEYKDTSLVD